MATQTTNLGLIKPGLTDKIRIAQINGNMDILDNVIGPVGNTSLQTQMSNAQSSVSALQDGLAIVSNNNAHPAIAQGQYVYVKNHGSLDEGLYVATTAIAANGTLSASNLTADSGGGLNTLSATLSEQMTYIKLTSATDFNTLTVGSNKKAKHYRGENIGNNTNIPSGFAGSNIPWGMDVIPIGDSYSKQILHLYGQPYREYERTQKYDNGNVVWQDWFSSYDQIDTLSNTAALCTKAEIIAANASATFTAARTIGLLIGEYGANNIMYTIFRASATNVSVGEIKTNGNITVTTNNGVITVANGSSNSWRVRVLEIG